MRMSVLHTITLRNLLFEFFNPLFERRVLLLEHLNELSFRMGGGLGFSYHSSSSLFTVATSFGHRLRHQEAVDCQVWPLKQSFHVCFLKKNICLERKSAMERHLETGSVNMCCWSRGQGGQGKTFNFLETSVHVRPL